jgi:hypothetical protein
MREDVMDKSVGKDQTENDKYDVGREENVRSLDDEGGDEVKFDPRGGEDPGLLELTEDPFERRLKRNTM